MANVHLHIYFDIYVGTCRGTILKAYIPKLEDVNSQARKGTDQVGIISLFLLNKSDASPPATVTNLVLCHFKVDNFENCHSKVKLLKIATLNSIKLENCHF
jgi:hypothetical protein